jgi:glyoxylase-like metal-dependent hydrolase (beta-lactamase superfamily II)
MPKHLSGVLVLIISLILIPVGLAEVEPDISMKLRKVSEHVYYVVGAPGTATDNAGFISNAGVIISDQDVTVFDALGTPALARMLLKRIRNVTDKPVARVIVSHYHADHIYGLQVFKEAGAEIIAPDGSQNYLNSPAAESRLEERRVSLFPWVDESTYLVWPDRYMTSDETIRTGNVELKMTHLGDAHSEADLSLYVLPDRVLLSGDIIFEGRVPFVGSANSRNWLRTLEELETQGLQVLIPGHGPAAANPQQTIKLTRSYLSFLRETMGEAVEELIPFDEAYAEADWSKFERLPAFTEANRRNAYQVYLSIEEETLAE